MRWTRWPPVRRIRFGSLRRVEPISRDWGFDRGKPVDRYYIERFLEANSGNIRGHVLEIADDSYTLQFGGDRVLVSDILNVIEGKPKTTIVADLTEASQISEGTFDCIICTQTLQLIYEVRSAVLTLHRILKPGGTLLATVPGISQISRPDMDRWGDFWRFTEASTRRLFGEVFLPKDITVTSFGNVLTATAFLHGLAAQELTPSELDFLDPDYQLLLAIRAHKFTKPAS